MASTQDHRSLKPDKSQKGSYYRRIEDIVPALEMMGGRAMGSVPRYLAYYFGCEKLAKGIMGIADRLPADTAYDRNAKIPTARLQAACTKLGIAVTPADLAMLFTPTKPSSTPTTTAVMASARDLRNTLVHDFGPTNVRRIEDHAAAHVPKMEAFLACAPQVLAYLEANFQHIQ